MNMTSDDDVAAHIDRPLHKPDALEDTALDPKPVPSLGGVAGKILDGLSGLCLVVASLALVVLVVLFGWLVFGRYVLNNTPTWVEQLALLLVIAITFLGSATLMQEDRHLGVTFLRDALPDRLRILVHILGDVTIAVFGAIMAVVCSELVAFGWGNTLPMLGIPEGIRSIPAVVCGALIALFAGARAIASARDLLRGNASHSVN